MVNFKENYNFLFQSSEGVHNFPGGGGGVQLFPGGVQLLIPYRNPYNLWFSSDLKSNTLPLSHHTPSCNPLKV